jgi:hypothetical protein
MAQPEFADWLAICNTKADYCRLLDTKQWDQWAQVFTEDVFVDVPESGAPPITTRDDFVWPLSKLLADVKTCHQVHAPLIEIEDYTAKVIWAMQDRLIWPDGKKMTGWGHYHEEYRRTENGWKIARLLLTRLFVEA